MSEPLSVTLRPSRFLALALTFMAGAALAGTWFSLPLPGFLPAAAGIVLAWIWHLAPALHRGRRGVRALELGAKGDARWQDGSGTWHEAAVQPGSYVSTWLVVVNLGRGRRDPSLLLLPDSAAADELRRLRVWLRWRLGRQ